jgi:hypothetical protein
VVLSALQQWGDEHLPRPEGPSMLRRVRGTDCPVHVGYLDDEGREVPPPTSPSSQSVSPVRNHGKTAN